MIKYKIFLKPPFRSAILTDWRSGRLANQNETDKQIASRENLKVFLERLSEQTVTFDKTEYCFEVLLKPEDVSKLDAWPNIRKVQPDDGRQY